MTGTEEPTALQRLGNAASEQVREAVRQGLSGLMADFLKHMPVALRDAASQVSVVAEYAAFEELSRSVTFNGPRWIDIFVQQVDAHLVGGVTSAGASQRSSDAESVVLAKVELRAETRYHKLVTELGGRVNRIRLMVNVPVHTKALAPAGLCRAMQDTADALNWPGRQRKLLFEQFDLTVINGLEGFYRSLIATLTELGTTAAKAVFAATVKPEAAPKPPPRPRKSATEIEAPADDKQLDSETAAMLNAFALKPDGEGYTDGLLAADLLALADQRPLPGIEQDESWVPLQRISLAGHFLNEVTSDPMVPASAKEQHETVRFPLVKSALTDQSFFTSATHPLGSLINELLLKSATSRMTGNRETRRMAELLKEVVVQFDLSPEFVRLALPSAEPIPETQIERFFELQRQQAQQRRDFVIAEARRMVARQLEESTFGRGVPPQAVMFLNQAWGPLLTKRLLHYGADHVHWKAALDLMEKLLDLLDAREPEEAPPEEWRQALKSIGMLLIQEGMTAERVGAALTSLEAARKAPPGGIS